MGSYFSSKFLPSTNPHTKFSAYLLPKELDLKVRNIQDAYNRGDITKPIARQQINQAFTRGGGDPRYKKEVSDYFNRINNVRAELYDNKINGTNGMTVPRPESTAAQIWNYTGAPVMNLLGGNVGGNIRKAYLNRQMQETTAAYPLLDYKLRPYGTKPKDAMNAYNSAAASAANAAAVSGVETATLGVGGIGKAVPSAIKGAYKVIKPVAKAVGKASVPVATAATLAPAITGLSPAENNPDFKGLEQINNTGTQATPKADSVASPSGWSEFGKGVGSFFSGLPEFAKKNPMTAFLLLLLPLLPALRGNFLGTVGGALGAGGLAYMAMRNGGQGGATAPTATQNPIYYNQ